MEQHDEMAEQLLRRSGLRRTPVRIAVLDLLLKSGRLHTVPQILGEIVVQGDVKAVDTVTVYRTLATFTCKKLVHRVRGEDRSWLYAASRKQERPRNEHEHPHFVCDACGGVECLERSRIPSELVKSLHVGPRYQVSYPEVVLHGVCPKCQ